MKFVVCMFLFSIPCLLFVYLFVYLFTYLSICLFVCIFACLFVYLPVCLFVYLFVCCLSVVYLFIVYIIVTHLRHAGYFEQGTCVRSLRGPSFDRPYTHCPQTGPSVANASHYPPSRCVRNTIVQQPFYLSY